MEFDPEKLKNELERIKDEHPQYADDHAFTYWWIQSVYGLNGTPLEKAVTGKPRDKGIDALWTDHEQQTVYIVQIKYRKWKGKGETRADIFQLPELTKIFWDEAEKNNYFQTLDAGIKADLTKAIKQVKERGYKIRLSFVTTGRISKELKDEAKKTAKSIYKTSKGKVEVDYRLNAYQQVAANYMDWEEYGSPEIGDYKIDMVTGGSMINPNIAYKDPKKKLLTWIGTVKSKDIGNMYIEKGRRIFATNIRGFLDKTPINTAMIETMKKEPENFWYYNNGVTIICNHMSATTTDVTSWNLEKPQIINGQQTVITLSNNNDVDANVVIKVIEVPRDEPSRDVLISNIVKATNWQNAIDFSDLVSNDAHQKRLENNLKDLKYFYVRKKYGKTDYAKASVDYDIVKTIKKIEMAKSVGACILDPVELRKGKKALFDENRHYLTIFNRLDVNFFLSCFLTHQSVKKFRKNPKGRTDFSKWFNVHLLWEQLKDTIESGEDAKRFRILHEKGSKYKSNGKSLQKIILHNYKMTRKFFMKESAGKNETDFYKKPGLPEEFEKFSKKENKQEMKEAERLVKDFKLRLKKIQLK